MPALFMASRKSASVPLPVASVTVVSVRAEFGENVPLAAHVPNEKSKEPVPTDAVSLE
jgi:hypothetical protein